MEGFPFVHRERVRFNDLDGLAHVNNAVFATYLENARIAFLGLRSFESMILARLELDFRSPVELGEEVEIGVRPSRIGTKSFELEYELRVGERLVAEAKTVLVAYDYSAGQSVELPPGLRETLEAAVSRTRSPGPSGGRRRARP